MVTSSPEPDPARRPVHHQPVGVVEVPRADVPPPPQLQGDPQRVGPLVLVGPVGVGRNALGVAELVLEQHSVKELLYGMFLDRIGIC